MGSDDRRRGGQNKKASSLPNGTRDPFLRVQNGPKTALHRDSWPDISIPLIRMQEPALAKCSGKGLPEAATVPLMDVHEARRLHLQRLIDEFAGGEQKKFAKLAGCSVGYLSQVINGFRNLGPTVARRIEAALEQPRGTMDRDPRELPQEAVELAREWLALPKDARDEVRAYIRIRRVIGGKTGESYATWEERVRRDMEKLKGP